MFFVANLAGATFLAYWYVVWPIPADWVAVYSPATLPQIRAFDRLSKTGEQYMWHQWYIEEGRRRFEQAAIERGAEVQLLLVECLRSDEMDLHFVALDLVSLVSAHEDLSRDLCGEILRGTRSTDDDLKYSSFYAIQYMPKSESEPLINDMLSSTDERLREIAVGALAKPGNRTLTQYLLPMLQAPEPGTRAFALDRFICTGDPEAIPAIRSLVKDSDSRVAAKAIEFLKKFPQQ